ncbi:MAG: hypothetical protein CMA63_07710 [Euryarchaeota archaeon]|nr:hypothetical protein [Euryarchaeota archaeon]
MNLTFQEVYPPRGCMAKDVLLVRGGALGPNSGIGGAHHSLALSLQGGEIDGWRSSKTSEYAVRQRSTPFFRLYQRWFGHPRRVRKLLKKDHEYSILHVTDQEQAHLIPEDCSVPVVVTVHDLFHLFPEVLDIAGEFIEVGEQNPPWYRRRDLKKLRQGLARADLLVCDSQATLAACQRHFPKVNAVCVPLGIDVTSFLRGDSVPVGPAAHFEKHCHLLIVGSHDPRKRLAFVCQVLGGLDETVKHNIRIHHVGHGECPYGGPAAIDYAEKYHVPNWTGYGGKLSSQSLMELRHACEALLFPSASEGFGYPPLEAMATGTPVVCSDLPSHNELMPEHSCVDPADIDAWREAIQSVYANWESRTKGDTTHVWPAPMKGLIEFASRYDQRHFCRRMGEVYDSL